MNHKICAALCVPPAVGPTPMTPKPRAPLAAAAPWSGRLMPGHRPSHLRLRGPTAVRPSVPQPSALRAVLFAASPFFPGNSSATGRPHAHTRTPGTLCRRCAACGGLSPETLWSHGDRMCVADHGGTTHVKRCATPHRTTRCCKEAWVPVPRAFADAAEVAARWWGRASWLGRPAPHERRWLHHSGLVCVLATFRRLISCCCARLSLGRIPMPDAAADPNPNPV